MHCMRERTPEELLDDIYWSERETLSPKLAEISRKVSALGCPDIIDSYYAFGEEPKHKPISIPITEWIEAMTLVHNLFMEIRQRESAIQDVLHEVSDLSKALKNSFPAEYDQEMFYPGWAYQCHVRGCRHWSIPEIPKDEIPLFKTQYDKCVALFKRMTAGLPVHNFSIVNAHKQDFSEFTFTCEGVPGTLEINFPLSHPGHLVQEGTMGLTSLPMQMCIAWRFHDVIPVLDHFFGRSYTLDEIAKNLKEFVETSDWRNHLHKKFVKRDETGKEIELDTAPEWYEEKIQESIAKASVEQQVGKEES